MENLGKVLLLQCGTKRDRQNQLRIMPWTFGWMLSFLAMTFAIRREWITSDAAVVAISIVIMGFGVGTMLAYRRFLREADELVRKIELDALVRPFGSGMFLAFAVLSGAAAVATLALHHCWEAKKTARPNGNEDRSCQGGGAT